jgi:beta-glucosidase
MEVRAGPKIQRFPDGFLWGAATAGHQVEGGNVNSDSWVLEHLPNTMFREPSGDACDFLHRYQDDVATVAALGLNAFRFGVEWARVEPESAEFSVAALDHYSRVVDACLEHGIAPVVTLHHFTSPRWLIREGGWNSAATPARFAEYASRVMRRLRDRVEWVCTINEANTPLQLAVNGLLTNDEGGGAMTRSLAEAAEAFAVAPERPGLFLMSVDEESISVITEAHRQAVVAIQAESSRARVGVTLSLQQAVAEPGGEAHAEAFDESVNRRFLRELGSVGDFVGVQNYTRLRFGPDGPLPATENVTGAGLELVPPSLAATCRQAADVTGLPVLITEHGADLDDDQDHRRAEFVESSLSHLAADVGHGLDVRGYLHWSLMDNYEWFNGYHGHFGLLGVDRATQRRWIRPSAAVLGRIARANGVAMAGSERTGSAT